MSDRLKRISTFVFLLFILAVIDGCKRKNWQEEYFPHHSGDYWKYKSSELTGYFSREFSGTTQIGERRALNWLKTEFDSIDYLIHAETSYIVITDTTILHYEDIASDPFVLLKLPLAPELTWTFYIDEEPIYASVTYSEDIEVEAGSFSNVYIVRYDDPDNEERRYIYYAPNVGIIKDVLYDYDNELICADELIGYSVKN